MDSVNNIMASTPAPVKVAFGAIGALYVFNKAFSFLQLLLNSFLLPGTSVSP
jgi:17beta-estradiol 17-dehydrogenase / very-long-chain 3-oxoacyl-CoA reductase